LVVEYCWLPHVGSTAQNYKRKKNQVNTLLISMATLTEHGLLTQRVPRVIQVQTIDEKHVSQRSWASRNPVDTKRVR
jgi:hypothetical protein